MKRILLMIAAVLITGMLLLGSPSMAHHWQNENENVSYTSRAGDPAYLEDAEACVGQTSGDQHCVVLYGHIFDLLNPVPINIQRPPEECGSMARGFSSAPPIEPFWSFNRQDMYSSPGFVEYTGAADNQEVNCENPRIHPERGLTSNVNVAQDVDIYGYWYMSADAFEVSALGLNTGGEGPLPHMGVLPCITVRMEMWTGRYVSTGSNEPLAIGQTTKSVVSTPYGQGINENETIPMHPCADGTIPDDTIALEEVTEFEVNMGQISREIRSHEGFVIGVQWWLHDLGDPEWDNDKLYHREWNLHTGPDYPNRIVLAVEDSIRVERVQPQLFDGKIYIHSVLNSPWGSYDVDTANLRVEVRNEAGDVVADQNSAHMADPILRYSVDHNGHFLPVNATWPWDFSQEDLQPGEYTIRVTATNWQHTADASRERTFRVTDDLMVTPGDDEEWEGFDGSGDVEDSPAIAAVLAALAAVVLAGIVSLRRRE